MLAQQYSGNYKTTTLRDDASNCVECYQKLHTPVIVSVLVSTYHQTSLPIPQTLPESLGYIGHGNGTVAGAVSGAFETRQGHWVVMI